MVKAAQNNMKSTYMISSKSNFSTTLPQNQSLITVVQKSCFPWSTPIFNLVGMESMSLKWHLLISEKCHIDLYGLIVFYARDK